MLRIRRSVIQDVCRHARQEAPRECGGVLLGADGVILWSSALTNVARQPSRFDADPLDLLAVEKRAAAEGRSILGHYHSHPTNDLTPSYIDREARIWPDLPPFHHLIVSPAGGWIVYDIRDGAWRPVEVELMDPAA